MMRRTLSEVDAVDGSTPRVPLMEAGMVMVYWLWRWKTAIAALPLSNTSPRQARLHDAPVIRDPGLIIQPHPQQR